MNTELLTLCPLAPRKVRSGKATDQVGDVVNCENRGYAVFHNFTGPGARFGLKKRC